MLQELTQTQKTQLEMILKEQEVILFLIPLLTKLRFKKKLFYGNQEIKQNSVSLSSKVLLNLLHVKKLNTALSKKELFLAK